MTGIFNALRNTAIAAAAAALIVVAVPAPGAHAECLDKAGQGTNTTRDGAKFQAWEIILQTTSFFGVWSPWMASSQKVGHAPGYKVSRYRERCKKGGIGYECVIQARLCN